MTIKANVIEGPSRIGTLLKEMLGAAQLKGAAYDEIDAHPSRDAFAVAIVILASVAAAIGAGASSLQDIFFLTIASLIGWMVWVFLTFIIGTRLLPGDRPHGGVGTILRATGFSATPGILRFLGIIPGLGWVVFLSVTIWMLAAFVVAIQHALNYSSAGRALAVCALGWLISGILFFAFVRVAI